MNEAMMESGMGKRVVILQARSSLRSGEIRTMDGPAT